MSSANGDSATAGAGCSWYRLPADILQRSDLTASAKLAVAIIRDYERRGVPVSIQRLANALGTTRPAIRRALSDLAAAGLVAISDRGAGRRRAYMPGTGHETLPVTKRDRSRNVTGTGHETLPETSHETLPPIPETELLTENNSTAAGASRGKQSVLSGHPPEAKGSRKAGNGKPKADADPRVSAFIRWFAGDFEKRTGRPYVVSGGKDGKAVKRLLASLTPEQLEAATAAMHADSWGESAASIGVLASQINKWLAGPRRNGTFRPATVPGDPGFQDVGRRYEDVAG